MKKIHLLHLIKKIGVGGIERSTVNLSLSLENKLEFIGIWAEDGALGQLIKSNSKVQLFYRKHGISSIYFFIYNLISLIIIIKKNQINVIHFHYRIFIPLVFIVKLLFPKIKIIYTNHSVFSDFINHFLFADIYIAVSQVTHSELLSNNKKSSLIKPGITLPPKNTLKKIDEIKRIGFVGRFHESKGILTLLNAFINIIQKKSYLKLILIGEGEQKYNIENFIYRNKLENKVFINPPMVDIERVYSQIDLIVVPSLNLEGFGLVIIEAMSFGIPVVVSDLPAFREIVEHLKNGLIFEVGNSSDLSDKILTLIKNKNLIENLVENAREYVEKNYQLERMTTEYYDLLKML